MHASRVRSLGRRRAFCLVSVLLLAAAATPLSATLDRNHDGLSDIWDRAYPAAGAPTADPDGDGATNLAESLAGTNPLDPASHFAVALRRTAAGALEFRWPSILHKNYELHFSNDLIEWFGRPGNFPGTGAELAPTILTAPYPATERQFWRVLAFDADLDGDLLTDWEEALLGTSPTLADTDHDGMMDLWEAGHGLNPLINDDAADPDGDGFSNLREFLAGTDPTSRSLPVATGPVAFWISQPVAPDETLLVTAGGIDLNAQIELAALPDDAPGSPLDTAALPADWTRLPALTATPRSITATVPAAWTPGVYALRLTNNARTSPTRLVNAPDPWFVQGDRGDTATPGGCFFVAGTSLEVAHSVSTHSPQAALVGSNGSVYLLPLEADATNGRLTTSKGYGLRFAVPATVPEGTYALYLHNGCGGPAGWVKFSTFITAPLNTVTVKSASAWPATVYDVSQQTGANDDARFAATIAQAEADGGGRIFVPAGTYTLNKPLILPPHTVLAGASRATTLIRWDSIPNDPATGKGVEALVRGRLLGWLPDYTVGTFALEDLSLQASDDFAGYVVLRAATQEPGWLKRVSIRASRADGTNWGAIPTALRLASVGNTQLEDLVLDAAICLYARENVTYLRLVRSTLHWRQMNVWVSGGNHSFLIADNVLNQRGDSIENQWKPTPDANPNPGLCFTSFFGRGWVGGPFTRDLLWAGNTTTRDPDVAELQPQYVGYTADGGEGMYLGRVDRAEGTTLHLAGPTRIPMTGELPPRPVPFNWAGAVVQILDGRGAGQWRFLTDVPPGETAIQIDRPWDIEPDRTSTVTVVNLQGRMLMVDNDFAQTPLTQDYFLALDSIKAGNQIGAAGTNSSVLSWAGNVYTGTFPAWHYQCLDNRVVRGKSTGFASFNMAFVPTDHAGVVGAAHVYRNNINSSAGTTALEIGSRDNAFADVVLERNQMNSIRFANQAPNGNPTEISLSGVVVRGNTKPGGSASPGFPAGVISGVSVAP